MVLRRVRPAEDTLKVGIRSEYHHKAVHHSINRSPRRVKVTAGVLQIFTRFYRRFTVDRLTGRRAPDAGLRRPQSPPHVAG